jgi:serine/tyrosine/threonine adenylyltransferase
MSLALPFNNSYARLPERFYSRLAPTPVNAPRLIALNAPLAARLGLDAAALATPAGIAVLAGNAVAIGSEPLAQAYAGHQFGGFQPQLGDGRAILLGEVKDHTGQRFDIQLKGSGPTPYSRNGDGRAGLGPVLREYIVSEAMAALGIPTTRSLAAVATGEAIFREQAVPGAILTRVAASHIRVGTFQYFAARDDVDGLRALADHAIERHYPAAADAPNRYLALLQGVIARQAHLIARWMGVGFIHGVMNTDNMTISGETIDYGPCAFMDTFNPAQVYSFIDRGGRYAYGNQPKLAQWNLARLAEALLPLLADQESEAVDLANAAISAFPTLFEAEMLTIFRAKLGLTIADPGDSALANAFLKAMAEGAADFTNAWRGLVDAALGADHELVLRLSFADATPLDAWLPLWRARLEHEAIAPDGIAKRLQMANPAIIPRNHRIEAAIRAAEDRDDFGPFEELTAVLATPFALADKHAKYALPPLPDERVQRTFCGT